MNAVCTEQKTEQLVIDDLVYLCGCAVNGDAPEAARVAEMDLPAIFAAAERHMLTAVAAYALETAGVHDQAFRMAKAKAVRKMVIVDSEMERVLEKLEASKIWYMPLKGAMLKDLYPAYGIRQMSDRDILIDPERVADVQGIMEDLGFTTEEYGEYHHDSYFKPPLSRFEMHHDLFEAMQGARFSWYYRDVRDRLLKDEGNAFGWHFSPEDFYIHMTAHEYKHYSRNGTGLRSLLDTYVYLKNTDLNFGYIVPEVEKLGIAEFEKSNRALALHLFNGDILSDSEQKMLERFADSGTYGSIDLFTENQLAAKGRGGYFLSRLTLPYAVMQEKYPVLKKVPVLYPFCWTHRLICALIYKNNKVKQQLKAGLTWKKN